MELPQRAEELLVLAKGFRTEDFLKADPRVLDQNLADMWAFLFVTEGKRIAADYSLSAGSHGGERMPVVVLAYDRPIAPVTKTLWGSLRSHIGLSNERRARSNGYRVKFADADAIPQQADVLNAIYHSQEEIGRGRYQLHVRSIGAGYLGVNFDQLLKSGLPLHKVGVRAEPARTE